VVSSRIADRQNCTLDALGGILGLTKERVRQIEARGLKKMREAAEVLTQ